MRGIYFIVSITALVVAAGSSNAQFRKYDVKSGIVTLETTMKMSGMDMTTKAVVYFDDYGLKECREIYSGDKLQSSFFSDGKNLYSVDFVNHTAYNRGTAYRGTELRVEWTEMGTKADRQSGKVKRVSPMTVAGKECEVFEAAAGGSVTRYAGWNKIMLFMESKGKDMVTTTKALKVETNVQIPPSKFEVPAGYKVE